MEREVTRKTEIGTLTKALAKKLPKALACFLALSMILLSLSGCAPQGGGKEDSSGTSEQAIASGSESDGESRSESETNIGSESNSESETKHEFDSNAGSETEQGSENNSDHETELESENKSEPASDPESGSELESESESETETEFESPTSPEPEKQPVLLTREDWAADVKQGLNDFMTLHGGGEKDGTYVVFDFDNTCSIFDTQVMMLVYQAERMAFAVDPNGLRQALTDPLERADVPDDAGLTELDWIEDITQAYTKLWETYGPFTPAGVDDATAERLWQDPYYTEFLVKMKALYSRVSSTESADVSCFWLHSAFTGMTREEYYRLAVQCFQHYSQVNSSYVTVVSPDPSLIPSRTGQRSTTITRGVYVTENIRELMQALSANGVEIYVCSASMDLTVCAAVDACGLRDHVTAVLGVSSKMKNENGREVLASLPAENGGFAWYPTGETTAFLAGKSFEETGEAFSKQPADTLSGNNGTSELPWKSGSRALQALPHGVGKRIAIDNAIVPEYGHGPAAGFMDSSGDFNFCTEYASLELVVCFNRGWRYVTDGGGLVGEVALLQASRGVTLESARAAGDTLYLLQGRDETGKGCFIADHGSVHLVPDQPSVYRLLENDQNEQMLSYMKEKNLSVAECFNTFSLRTKEGKENLFSFPYGFLDSYDGYHSH